jgi:hypothetical protein
MRLTDFHTMRRAVQNNASPAFVEELQVVADRVREALLGSGVFEDVEVEQTDDRDQLVIAMCRFSAPLTEEVAELSLEWLWENELRYGFWASHGTLVEPGQVEFEGATRASTWGRYVTVHIIAQTVAVPAQRGPEQTQSADVVAADL